MTAHLPSEGNGHAVAEKEVVPAAAAKPQKNLANGVRFCYDKPAGSIVEVSRTVEANGKRTY